MQTSSPDAAGTDTAPRSPESDPAREDVRGVLQRLSAAWQARRYDDLAACFDEHAVLVAPGFAARLEGRAAVVESYREFMERVTVTTYREDEAAIDLWGDIAVATYRWTMAWEADGTPNRESGYDILVLRRGSAGGAQAWSVVWRTLTSAATSA